MRLLSGVHGHDAAEGRRQWGGTAGQSAAVRGTHNRSARARTEWIGTAHTARRPPECGMCRQTRFQRPRSRLRRPRGRTCLPLACGPPPSACTRAARLFSSGRVALQATVSGVEGGGARGRSGCACVCCVRVWRRPHRQRYRRRVQQKHRHGAASRAPGTAGWGPASPPRPQGAGEGRAHWQGGPARRRRAPARRVAAPFRAGSPRRSQWRWKAWRRCGGGSRARPTRR